MVVVVVVAAAAVEEEDKNFITVGCSRPPSSKNVFSPAGIQRRTVVNYWKQHAASTNNKTHNERLSFPHEISKYQARIS